MINVIEFIKEVLLIPIIVIGIIFILVWGCCYFDRSNSDWLLKEKSYVITAVYPKTNQFVINGSFILSLGAGYKFDNNEVLEIKDIIDGEFNNRVRVNFNNDFGY